MTDSTSLVLAVALSAAAAMSAPSQTCLNYEPAVVTLTGKLTIGAFAGRPNYEDTLKGDEPEHPFILRLDRTVCVQADSSSELNNESERDVREVQVIVTSDSVSVSRALEGHRIQVTGSLVHAHTAHHHTKVLRAA